MTNKICGVCGYKKNQTLSPTEGWRHKCPRCDKFRPMKTKFRSRGIKYSELDKATLLDVFFNLIGYYD